MAHFEIRGFYKPTRNHKLIIDQSISPIEIARSKYFKLYEEQIKYKKDKENKEKSILSYIFEQIKQTL